MSYALRHTTGFYDIAGNLWTVEIHPLNYTGASGTIAKMGATPLVFDYGKSTTQPHKDVVQDTRCTFSLQSTSLLQLSYLFDHNKKKNKVIVKLAGNVFFTGFVVGDTYSEPYRIAPFFVEVNASDGLLLLKDRDWDVNDRVTPLYVIMKCLQETGLDLNFKVTCSTTVTEPTPEADALGKTWFNTEFFVTEKYTYFDALEHVLRAFGLTVKQVGGKWEVTQFSEQAKGSYAYTEYTSTGTLVGTGTTSPVINASGTGIASNCALLTSSYINITPAYKRFTIKQLLGFKGSIIQNFEFNDFELTGLLGEARFTHWQPRGTITAGLKDGDNYAVVNGVQTGATPDVNTNYIDQNFGFVTPVSNWANMPGLKLEIDWAILADFGVTLEADVYIKIKIGTKSLVIQTPDGQPTGYWVTGDSVIQIGRAVGKSKDYIEFQKFELNIAPDVLAQGWTQIRLYAPVNAQTSGGGAIKGAVFSKIVLKPQSTEWSTVDEDVEFTTDVENQSNYEPSETEVALGDVPDFGFADMIYSNILGYQYSGFTKKWKFTTYDGLVIEDTLLLVLAGQIEQMFNVNRLMLQANLTSDILRFNSLLTDTARLGTKTFALMRASLDAKRLAWQNAELIEIGGGDIVPDFDKPDYEDFDFFTE